MRRATGHVAMVHNSAETLLVLNSLEACLQDRRDEIAKMQAEVQSATEVLGRLRTDSQACSVLEMAILTQHAEKGLISAQEEAECWQINRAECRFDGPIRLRTTMFR